MNEFAYYCLLIGKILMAVSLAIIFVVYVWVSLDLMTKQQEEFSRRHKKYLARQKKKEMLPALRKACRREMKRYAREAERLHKGI